MINYDYLNSAKRISVQYQRNDVSKEDILKFREENKLTQLALANILGVKKATIQHWESGKHRCCGSHAILLTLLINNNDLISQIRKVEMR